jgi:hypothetical protein
MSEILNIKGGEGSGSCKICRYMFVTYHVTKFHKPSSNGSFIITTKPEEKYEICMATMLLFYSAQKKKKKKT